MNVGYSMPSSPVISFLNNKTKFRKNAIDAITTDRNKNAPTSSSPSQFMLAPEKYTNCLCLHSLEVSKCRYFLLLCRNKTPASLTGAPLSTCHLWIMRNWFMQTYLIASIKNNWNINQMNNDFLLVRFIGIL